MAKKNNIPEVDIVVDEKAGVIREVPAEPKLRSKKGHERRVNASIYIVLIVMSIIWLCPFVFLVLQSFRGESGGQVAYVIPKQWTLDNYRFLFEGVAFNLKALVQDVPAIILTVLTTALGVWGMTVILKRKPRNPYEETGGKFKNALLVFAGLLLVNFMRCVDSSNCDFVQWFMNTLTIALFCAVIQTIMVLSVSYTLSRMRFKGRKLIMNVVLVLGMFPGFLTMIVLYYLLKMMGLTQAGAVPGLILISCASSGMGYYISKGFFDTIPKSLESWLHSVLRVRGTEVRDPDGGRE